MSELPLYTDALVEITLDSLIIKDCYFPGISKQIPLVDILCIQVLEPSIWNGSWRIWGTGLLVNVWFAMDWKRPWRDDIFIVNLRDSWFRIGFTAESSAEVIRLLTKMKIPVEYE